MVVVKLHQPVLCQLLDDRDNYYLRLYLSEYKREGEYIYSEVHNNELDLKFSILDMGCNVGDENEKAQVNKLFAAHNNYIKFNVVNILHM